MATARRGGLDLLHERDDGHAGQRGGDGDGEGRREKYHLLHDGFPKLGAPHMIVLVCFAQRVG